MSITYYLVRHGQTEWNAQGRSQGRLDSPLTELGLAQAHLHARTLAPVPLARAYASLLPRAAQTAQIILRGRDVPLTLLDDLAELDHGELSGLLKSERKTRYPELMKARRRDKFRTVLPGGESYESASPRVARALERIAQDGPGSVLIVSHSQVGRLLRLHLLGLKPMQAMKTHHPQDTIYLVRHGTLAVSEGGGPFRAS